jgi:hypothetical protein
MDLKNLDSMTTSEFAKKIRLGALFTRRCPKVRLWEITAAAFPTDSGWMTAHQETIRMELRRAYRTSNQQQEINEWLHRHSNACISSLNRTGMDHFAQS